MLVIISLQFGYVQTERSHFLCVSSSIVTMEHNVLFDLMVVLWLAQNFISKEMSFFKRLCTYSVYFRTIGIIVVSKSHLCVLTCIYTFHD